MSWYSDFQQKLAAVGSNASMTRGQSAFDIAYSLSKVKGTGPTGTLSTASAPEGDTPWYMQPIKKLGEVVQAVDNNTMGHKILEGLDAPGNAVRSLLSESLTQDNQADNPALNLNYDYGKLGDALIKGFFHEGDRKYTSGASIAQQYADRNASGKGDIISGFLGAGDAQPGEADSSDWQRAIQGFGIEVASDPLSFMSPAHISKVLKATGVSGAVAKGLEKAGLGKNAVKNTAKSATEAAPSDFVPNSREFVVQPDGTTAARATFVDDLVKKYNDEATPRVFVGKPGSNKTANDIANAVDNAEPSAPIQGELDLGLPPATPVVREGLAEAPAATQAALSPGQGAFDFGLNSRSGFASDLVHADLQAQKANLESALSGVVGKRYNVTADKVPSLFSKTKAKDTTRIVEDAVPAKTVKESAILHTVSRLFYEDAANGGRKYGIRTDPDTGEMFYNKNNKPVESEEALRKYIANIAADPKQRWQKDRIIVAKEDGSFPAIENGVAIAGGKGNGISAVEYAQRLIKGEPITQRGLFIPKEGELVDLGDYMKSRTEKWKDAEIFGGKPAVTEVVPGGDVVTRLNGKARTEWGNAMKGLGFSEDDIKYISSGRSESAVAGRVTKVLGRAARFDFPGLKELTDAYKLGFIDKDTFLKTLANFGGATTPGQAAKHVAKIDERLAKYSARVEAKASKVAALDKEALTKAAIKATEVQPAETIIDAVRSGAVDSKLLDGAPVGNLDRMEKESVTKALQGLAKKTITVPKGWKDTTATGAKVNGKNAVYLKGNNVFNQYTLHREIVGSPAMRRAVSTNNAEQVYSTYMRLMSSAEYVMRREGLEPILGRGASGVPLSLHDVLGTLPKEFVLNNFIKYDAKASKQLAPSLLMEAAHTAARFAANDLSSEDAIRQLLDVLKTSKMTTSTGKTFTSGYASTLTSKEAQRAAVRMFIDAGPAIQQRIQNNLARNAITEGNQIRALSDEVINNFESLMQQPHNFNGTDLLKLSSDKAIRGAVADGAKKMSAGDNVVNVVNDEALATVAEILPKAAMDAINKGIGQIKPTILVNTAEAATARTKTVVDLLDSQIDELADVPVYDVSEKLQMSSMARIIRGFAPHIANEDLHQYMVSQYVHANQVAYANARSLNRLAKTYTGAQIKEAFNFLQRGEDVNKVTGPLKDAVTDVGNVMKYLFDDGDTGVLVRNGITPQHVAAHMQHVGLGKYELTDLTSWKNWDVENPLDTFSRMFTAVMRAHAEVQLGAQISKVFGKTSPAGLEKAVKISDTRGYSRFATVLDRSLFYDEAVAKQIHVMSDMLQQVSAGGKYGQGAKILSMYDKAMHAYKSGLTIYRPGHHIRNQLGDMWLSAMDGMTDPKYYRDATSVLRVNKSKYSDWDPDLSFKVQPGKAKFKYRYNGKEVALSPETMYDLMYRNGGLPEYSTIEDLGSHMAQEEVGAASNNHILDRVKAPFGGRVHKAAAAVSESRDHYMRAAHFLYAMDQTPLKGKTLEEALQNAAQEAVARVRRYHPDGSDLGAAEKTVMRRLIPFYSWIRKAIPLVLESMVMRPGAFLAYPRGMAAWATANGIDPQSIAEPFPTDQLFPSWLSESTQGPQFGEEGSYAGLRPGLPGPDVLDQYLSGPGKALQTTMGGITPIIKIPVELAGGHKLGTGAPVGNLADYILQQAPMGATGGALLGDPFAQQSKSNANYDSSYMGGAKGTAAFNWLTGLGLTDMSKPSYIKSARYEAKQNAGK